MPGVADFFQGESAQRVEPLDWSIENFGILSLLLGRRGRKMRDSRFKEERIPSAVKVKSR
jgi:hypothetical protein